MRAPLGLCEHCTDEVDTITIKRIHNGWLMIVRTQSHNDETLFATDEQIAGQVVSLVRDNPLASTVLGCPESP